MLEATRTIFVTIYRYLYVIVAEQAFEKYQISIFPQCFLHDQSLDKLYCFI